MRPFGDATSGPFAFLWKVAVDGYRWDNKVRSIESPDDPGLFLVTSVPVEATQYAPLAVPALHRKFGRLEPTQGRILRFAEEYGLLTGGQPLIYPGKGQQELRWFGEPLSLWQAEIAQMSDLLGFWDLARKRPAGPLGKLVIWRNDPLGVAVRRRDSQSGLVGMRVLASETDTSTASLLNRWSYGDVVEPAQYYVHLEVNERLRGHVTPAVLPFNKGEILMFPDSLLSAMYTLFALELSGRQRPSIECAGCGVYFPPQHGSQRYCRQSCRKQRWYHQSPRSPKVAGRDGR